jgi:hypothetical protein
MPTQWRPALLDPATLQLFFDLYDALPSSLSPMVSNNNLFINSEARTVSFLFVFSRLYRVSYKWLPSVDLYLIMPKEPNS